jgi:Cdc6-like AAA superfamily ATPase
MLEDLGFGNVRKPLVMDATMQLADKLHAISRPGKRRGRDLVDIALLMEHEHIGYDELRKAARRIERSQLQHDIHMLDENEKESYRPTFERTNTERDFDECWNAVQGILRQVDVDHKDEWTKRPPFDCAAA